MYITLMLTSFNGAKQECVSYEMVPFGVVPEIAGFIPVFFDDNEYRERRVVRYFNTRYVMTVDMEVRV